MGSYFRCLGKYATFSGRSTRGEFWGYTVVHIILLGGMFYFYFTAGDELSRNVSTAVVVMYIILTFCPSLAVTSRRWHDIGRTGKWLWLNLVIGIGTIVTFGFMLTQGEEGTNEYGRNPRERKIRRKKRRKQA